MYYVLLCFSISLACLIFLFCFYLHLSILDFSILFSLSLLSQQFFLSVFLLLSSCATNYFSFVLMLSFVCILSFCLSSLLLSLMHLSLMYLFFCIFLLSLSFSFTLSDALLNESPQLQYNAQVTKADKRKNTEKKKRH